MMVVAVVFEVRRVRLIDIDEEEMRKVKSW
jgi:hypothetical protein